jgi:hypothetical protein
MKVMWIAEFSYKNSLAVISCTSVHAVIKCFKNLAGRYLKTPSLWGLDKISHVYTWKRRCWILFSKLWRVHLIKISVLHDGILEFKKCTNMESTFHSFLYCRKQSKYNYFCLLTVITHTTFYEVPLTTEPLLLTSKLLLL